MKIILSLLISLIISKSLISAYEELFVNIVPYSDSDCSGTPNGEGYSSIAYTCITFNFTINHIFKPSKDNNGIVIESYQSKYGETVCQDENKLASFETLEGGCFPFSDIGSYYIDYISGGSIENTNGYYKVFTSSSTPYIPSNSIVSSFMPDQCLNDSSNALLYQYLTNGTIMVSLDNYFDFDYITSGSGSGAIYSNNTFYCSNGTPMLFDDSSVVIKENCRLYNAFYNSSIAINGNPRNYNKPSSPSSSTTGGFSINNYDNFDSSESVEPKAYINVYCSIQ